MGTLFWFKLHERVSLVINYPKDFMDIALTGNGSQIVKRAEMGLI